MKIIRLHHHKERKDLLKKIQERKEKFWQMKSLRLSPMVLNLDMNVAWQESFLIQPGMRLMMREGWPAIGTTPGLNMTVWIHVYGSSASILLNLHQPQTWNLSGMVPLSTSPTMSAMFVNQKTSILNGTETCQSTMWNVCLEEVGMLQMFGQYVSTVS